jgi:LysR family glycine cleavage system transcriptional activator
MTDFRHLPNLSALRAFESAARHESFTKAAGELHLTHGAISHQVRRLEADLGLLLFNRKGKSLHITQAGRRFAHSIQQALREIASTAHALQQEARPHHRLTISAIPSMAARWLAPRLGGFIEQYPDVEVVLQSSGQLQDLVADRVDVGIRFGRGHYPGLKTDLLMQEVYYPVASPGFNGGCLPTHPSQLQGLPLLRSLEPWQPWFEVAGLDLTESHGGVLYEDMSMLIRAALNGEGVALVRHAVVHEEVRSGALVRLFNTVARSAGSYYLACPSSALERPEVRAFRVWVLDQAEVFSARYGWVPPS